jgi:calcineurin-like phosphoesterase family protein
MWYFTADQHFDHGNIIHHTARPFIDTPHMNLLLIEHWNSVVTPQDTVVVLGDFAWTKNYYEVQSRFMSKLNGSKLFLKGNHDYWWKGPSKHIYRKKIGALKFFCCHYPMRSWVNRYNLHGHSHGTLPPWKNQFDVGVDNAVKWVNLYRPLTYIEVANFIEQQNKELVSNADDYHEGEMGNSTELLLECDEGEPRGVVSVWEEPASGSTRG